MQIKLLQFIAAFGGVDVVMVASRPSKREDGIFNSRDQIIGLSLPREMRFDTWILSKNNIHNSPELTVQELFTLAHELGHAVSFRQGFHTQELMRSKFLSSIGMGVDGNIIKEEERAWEYGEWVLRSIGWTDFESFKAEKEWALNTYRQAAA